MSETWIFGYGSLIWRPALNFEERRPVSIHGWTRRFWQGSPDHRGTPSQPGRVVTLIPDPHGGCCGVAYRLGGDAEAALARLDHRERAGYQRLEFDLGFASAVTWVATEGNPDWLGCAPLDQMVDQVVSCVGPSGTNAEYVLRLAGGLRALNAHDRHVYSLADAVELALA